MKNTFFKCEKTISIDGHYINYYHRIGTGDEAIVFLHGYPTSSLDYIHVWDLIPEKYTIVVHDHLGFGKSDKPSNHPYLLIDQANYSLQLYHHLALSKIHIVAHDYGTSIATEIISRDNKKLLNTDIQSVTLSNGSMLIDMAKLRPIQRLLKSIISGPIVARLSSEKIFHHNMKNLWYDTSLYDREMMKEHWRLLIANNGRTILSKLTRYIDQRYKYYNRWIGALQETNLQVHILWAENDPVAVVTMADRLETIIPNNNKTIMKNCGHYPMIEQPQQWIELVLKHQNNISHF